ncbi:MraZ protein [Pedobacter sp. UYEF25]
MTQLIGEFDCRLDAKGRLMVPSVLKKQLPMAEQDGLVINRGFEKNLIIYPKNIWDSIVAELGKLNIYESKNRAFIRSFTRGATILSLDATGRILLPKSLADYAGLGTEIVLACQLDRIEVWDKNAYEGIFDNVPENFANLAEEVMGKRERGGDA